MIVLQLHKVFATPQLEYVLVRVDGQERIVLVKIFFISYSHSNLILDLLNFNLPSLNENEG